MSSVAPVSAARRAPAPALAPFPQAFAALPRLAQLDLALCVALLAGLVVLLYPHWSDNPDLSHGYAMPFVFLLLVREARAGTPRFISSPFVPQVVAPALILLGLAGLAVGGLYAAAVDWSHAVVASTLAWSAVLLLAAHLLVFASPAVRLVPCNWTACVALGLWLLSAPIPPGTYSRLTIGLQLFVTESVLRALHLLGIAAERHGNIIDLATTTVGVEEACSGVRSLISCVFAGFFFSATLVRRPWARAVLIALAAPLAIAMNFVRSLTLTLLANAGTDISGTWHDATGFVVLGVTAFFLGGLALLLERKPAAASPAPASRDATPAPASPRAAARLYLPLTLGLAATFVLAAFFYANTRPSIRRNLPVPDLAAVLPAEFAGWHIKTENSIYQFTETLRTDHLAQRTYLRQTPEGIEQITIYLAYWRAGQASVSLVASHTPDACWPGSGWTLTPAPELTGRLVVAGRALPPAEARRFENSGYPQYVWFWHLYDGRPIPFRDPYSARALLAIAARYGFSHDGDQLFVRISSNRPWSTIGREPLVAEVLDRLAPLGLK
jgi:exosortase